MRKILIHNAIQNHNTLDEIRELISSGIDVNKQEQDRVDRADVYRTAWGRAPRGDGALAPRRGSGRQQAGRGRDDRADDRHAIHPNSFWLRGDDALACRRES